MSRERLDRSAAAGEHAAVSPAAQPHMLLQLQALGDNQQLGRLLGAKAFPRSGEIRGTWSAALRGKPCKDESDPHQNTLADLPEGTKLVVTGREKGVAAPTRMPYSSTLLIPNTSPCCAPTGPILAP